MLKIPQIVALKQLLNKIKLTNKDVASHFNYSPTTISKNRDKQALYNSLKLKIIFRELTHRVIYKEWRETKKARALPLEEGTFFIQDILSREKDQVSFEELELQEDDLAIINKTGIILR